jgi:DNA-binding winged helix-turn-helix (wHTH) protein
LTKTTCLIDYTKVASDYVTIGTQLVPQSATDTGPDPGHAWAEHVPPPGADGTLLAIVPIPGTQTSLAIVSYAISNASVPRRLPAGAEAARDPEPEAAWPGQDLQPDLAAALAVTPGPDLAGLLIDRAQRRVWADGDEIPLTFQEFELLAFLSAHPAEVFSRADLLRRVWQPAEAEAAREAGRSRPAAAKPAEQPPRRPLVRAGTRTVDVHVSRLRRKLGSSYGPCLVTEHRAGYQFRPPADVLSPDAADNVINTSCRAE